MKREQKEKEKNVPLHRLRRREKRGRMNEREKDERGNQKCI